MKGNVKGSASKGICCCDRKAVIWEFSSFLLPNKTKWALVYSPEALCFTTVLGPIHIIGGFVINRGYPV